MFFFFNLMVNGMNTRPIHPVYVVFDETKERVSDSIQEQLAGRPADCYLLGIIIR